MKKLIGIGDCCIDYYAQTDTAYPGGNPVNVAVYYNRLGGRSAYIGSVGTDRFGKIMTDALKNKNVDVSHVHVDSGTTAVTDVKLVNGDRVLGDYNEGVMADFALNENDFDFISTYDIVISGFWGHCLNDFERLHKSGITTAFDFATKIDDPSVTKACRWMDYSFFSYDGDDEKRLRGRMRELHEAGTKIVIATRGEKGSLVFDGNSFTEFGIIPCTVVDTIGAGDSYIAGFLFAQGEKKDIKTSMEYGARTSAETIEYKGAW